jgi:hypothetical protein
MQQTATSILEETHGPWRLEFYVATAAPDSPPQFAVSILRDGELLGRRTAARAGLTDKTAIELLRKRALDWIADYDARDHSGSTDFGDL